MYLYGVVVVLLLKGRTWMLPPSLYLCNIGQKWFFLVFRWWILYLLKLVGDHGKGLENCICWPGDGDYPLRAIPLWDVDTCTTLQVKKRNKKYMIMRQKCLFGVLIFAEKFYSRLHAFSSPFLLSGSKDKEHYWDVCVFPAGVYDALNVLLVEFVINTFPMMLPTSCRNTKKQC